MSSPNPLQQLSEAGVSIWLDDLSRQRLNSGNLEELIRDWHLVGVTSNPTIFAKAVAAQQEYAEHLAALAAREASPEDAVREITTDDVRSACDLLRPVWERTGGQDGRVSIEVNPDLAHDTDGTVSEALEVWKTVDRPNLFVKIPATREGLPAITRTLGHGVSVNVTLIFSVRRYRQVMAAFLAGMERAAGQGHDLSTIASVASFFVSRVDAEADRRLTEIGTDRALGLRGEAAVANARLAYAAHQEVLNGPRWAALEQAGAARQRPLWASTGMKNPDYPDTMYVTELVAPNVVNTMPEATLEAFADHGVVLGDLVTGTASEAEHTVDMLAEAGVDLEDVCQTLEDDGVRRFAESWHELHETVHERLNL